MSLYWGGQGASQYKYFVLPVYWFTHFYCACLTILRTVYTKLSYVYDRKLSGKYGLSKGHSFEFIRITDIAKSNYQYRQMIYRYRYLIIFIDIGKWLTAIGNLIHRYQKIFKSNFTQLKALRVFYRRLHVTESTLRTVSDKLWERSSTQKHNYENIFKRKKFFST